MVQSLRISSPSLQIIVLFICSMTMPIELDSCLFRDEPTMPTLGEADHFFSVFLFPDNLIPFSKGVSAHHIYPRGVPNAQFISLSYNLHVARRRYTMPFAFVHP